LGIGVFIANARELNVAFEEFCALFTYSTDYQLRGFTTVANDKLEEFYAKYDDLYSILVRLEKGEPILTKAESLLVAEAPRDLVEIDAGQVEEVLKADDVSDHVRMQWKLARLGLKAGERVWVPIGDQARLRRSFQFDGFDTEFAAGVDLPHSYMENIDVVWKQEYRIGAAYEIENSTSIYSGLLRFADLNILAPNTIYPMFVVAPAERKNRVREQLKRPAFRKLGLDKKVKFLSYERIDAIDTFFADSNAGLSVETVEARAELVA
jgi:hypothetical protein